MIQSFLITTRILYKTFIIKNCRKLMETWNGSVLFCCFLRKHTPPKDNVLMKFLFQHLKTLEMSFQTLIFLRLLFFMEVRFVRFQTEISFWKLFGVRLQTFKTLHFLFLDTGKHFFLNVRSKRTQKK